MLPELYRPSCVADLAWSREKRESLLNSMQEQMYGNTNAHIHLLYGPSGCGKLSAVEVLFRQAVCNVSMTRANCTDAHASNETLELGRHVEINTFHTCDNSTAAYGQFLQRIVLLLTASLDNAAAASVNYGSNNYKNKETTTQSNESSSGTLTLQEYSMEKIEKDSTEEYSEECCHHQQCEELALNRHVEKREHAINARAFIVKLYGEDANDYLHRYTREFVWAYENICESALRWQNSHDIINKTINSESKEKYNKEKMKSEITSVLQENQIFFIHTIHDTHSPKVDLADSIPPELLNSNRVSLFRCTPITHINMMRRLCDVVNAELNKSKIATCNKVVTTSLSMCEKTPTKMQQKAANRKRTRKSQLLPQNEFISSNDLEIISQTSQGDLRQALLQTQWVLLAPTMQESRESIQNVLSTELKDEKPQQQQPEEQPKERRENETEKKYKAQKDSATCNTVKSCTNDKSRDSNTVYCDADEEEVVFVKEIKENKSKGQKCKVAQKRETTTSKSTSKSSVIRPLTECKREDSVSVLDLLTQQEEESEDKNATLAPHKSWNNDDVGNGSCKDDSNKNTPTDKSDLNSETVKRISVVTVRDEYLGLSHATGRLLTQKYALWDVLRLLNVSSRKVLDYLTNNMPAYFASDQINDYALCASSASECDALRESTIAFNNEFHRHTYETEENDEAIVISMAHNLLDYMSLVVFDKTYRVRHHCVSVPRTFMPQRPPPFMPHAYPRLRCNRTSRFRTYNNTKNKREYRLTNVDDNEPILRSSVDVYNSFMARLDAAVEKARGANIEFTPNRDKEWRTSLSHCNMSLQPITRTPPITSEEEDIVRECLPCIMDRCGCAESVITDYYPLAQYIILNRVNTLAHDVPIMNDTKSVKVNDEPKSTLPSLFQHVDRTSKVMNNSNNSKSSSSNNTIAGQSARRTTFRFTAQSEQAIVNKTPSVGQFTTTVPKRSCNELQFKLLRRGLQPNTFIRGEFFYINTNTSDWNSLTPVESSSLLSSSSSLLSKTDNINCTLNVNTVQGASAQCSHVIRPMIPANDIIEDFSDEGE